MPKEIINNIIKAAVRAPSGDNSQPWRFSLKNDNTLLVFNIPDKDNPVFNFRQRGSYVAHGALIENISIAAEKYGYLAQVLLFPNNIDPNLVAEISFSSITPKENSLYSYIFTRTTNRKPYTNAKLNDEQKNILIEIANKFGVKFILVEDKIKCETLARAVSLAERIILEHRALHKYFFNHIRWTEEEELRERSGLYIKTFEISLPQLIIFKILRFWSVSRILNTIGLSKFIAKENSKIYSSCAAFGAIITDDKNQDFITAGRAFERMWLENTKMGLSTHPFAGVIYLAQRVFSGDTTTLSKKHNNAIKKAFSEIQSALDIKSDTVSMLFRIGQDGEPSARSSRLNPDIDSFKEN
ncbi:nitroreductase family protein [Candidatus Giovannonibacteria bacterium]|nr:nitroreductase family protein [Candidatus Giovannonibacteria bacterium]